MNGIQLQVQKEALSLMLQRLEAIRVSCNTCDHMIESGCRKFGEMPPSDVLPVGCDEWEFDDIPF